MSDTDKTYAIDYNDEYIGSISLKHINPIDKNAEFAISIRKKYREQGLGKEAIHLILQIAFEELNLNKVYLNVLSNNERAIRLYQSVGFEYEGELKEHICINNEFKSLKLYGIWKNSYLERTLK